jgi:hypothetical protein
VREQGKNIDNIVRLLMWNPENLAQRLDLDKAVPKGKQARTTPPHYDQYEKNEHIKFGW